MNEWAKRFSAKKLVWRHRFLVVGTTKSHVLLPKGKLLIKPVSSVEREETIIPKRFKRKEDFIIRQLAKMSELSLRNDFHTFNQSFNLFAG